MQRYDETEKQRMFGHIWARSLSWNMCLFKKLILLLLAFRNVEEINIVVQNLRRNIFFVWLVIPSVKKRRIRGIGQGNVSEELATFSNAIRCIFLVIAWYLAAEMKYVSVETELSSEYQEVFINLVVTWHLYETFSSLLLLLLLLLLFLRQTAHVGLRLFNSWPPDVTIPC